ncbi:11714_t:CDS:2, partial [Racocetra persica]
QPNISDDNLSEINNYDEAYEDVHENISSHIRITKRRPLEILMIPDAAFEQASKLCRIQDKKLDKNTTDLSEQRHRESVKTDCTCFINMCWLFKSSNLTITKMNLEHHGYDLNSEIICFHTLRQLLCGKFKEQLFLDKDLANAIQQFRRNNIIDSEWDPENDASNLLKELQKMKKNDSTWFITYHYIKNHLYYIFWMTSYQQTLYLKYYDIILTDNTALMSDETTSSYIWVLKNLLAATNNLLPMTIYSDCDTGLGPAIES